MNDLRRWMMLVENMTHAEAVEVFKNAGINSADMMTATQLQKSRNKAAKRLHPDKGGSDEAMRNFNAAYDVLKNNSPQAKRKASAPTERPFDMSSFGDDDRPDPMEHIHVNCFPMDRPTIEVTWYSRHRSIIKSEAEQLLALKDGISIALQAEDRNVFPDKPPHRARATRTADQVIFQFTHHSNRGGEWSAEWSDRPSRCRFLSLREPMRSFCGLPPRRRKSTRTTEQRAKAAVPSGLILPLAILGSSALARIGSTPFELLFDPLAK